MYKRNLLKLKSKKSQAGVTLLLAILVLSSILAISFSLSAILLTEVRTSGDLLRTEGAFYGSQAVTEEALFKFKHNVPTCPTNAPNCITYSTQVGTVNLNNPAPVESSVTTPIFQIIVPPSSNSFQNTTIQYPIYDSANPLGGSGYGKLSLTYLSGGNYPDPLKVYVCEFDPNSPPSGGLPCSDASSQSYWITPPGGYDLRTSNSPYEISLNPGLQQQLILYNGSGSSARSNIYVQVQAFGASPGFTPKGLPLIGSTAVDINAQNSGVNRKIRVIIPNNSTTSSGSAPVAGQIILTVDNQYNAFFNGTAIGSDPDWTTAETYPITFQVGKNVIAVQAIDAGGCFAGLLADITKGAVNTGSDISWKVSSTGPLGWEQTSFDDSSWANSVDEGAYGVSPWGNNVSGMPNSTPGHWIWNTTTPPCGGGTLYFRGVVNN